LPSSGDLLSFAQAILRIKAFYGTSLKAVKTQVWVAISVYGLVAIVKKQLRLSSVSTKFSKF
jgi:hypothetical protein